MSFCPTVNQFFQSPTCPEIINKHNNQDKYDEEILHTL
jgi:hypothetical protein